MKYCIDLSDNVKEVDRRFRSWFSEWYGCTCKVDCQLYKHMQYDTLFSVF